MELWLTINGLVFLRTLLAHLPIIEPDHAPILFNLTPLTKGGSLRNFKFEARWPLHDGLFDLVKDVCSLFLKGSHAYQLARKIYTLQTAIKAWNKSRNNDSNNYLYNLSKELEII